MPKPQIRLAVLVDVGGGAEGPRPEVPVVDAALSDVEEDSHVLETSAEPS